MLSSGRKDAFLLNLVRVCGFVKARACAIWRLQIEVESEIWNSDLHIELTPRPSVQKLYTVKLLIFSVLLFSVQFWRSSSGERNIKILRLCRQNHSESTDSDLNLRPPDCNRTRPKSLADKPYYRFHIPSNGDLGPQLSIRI